MLFAVVPSDASGTEQRLGMLCGGHTYGLGKIAGVQAHSQAVSDKAAKKPGQAALKADQEWRAILPEWCSQVCSPRGRGVSGSHSSARAAWQGALEGGFPGCCGAPAALWFERVLAQFGTVRNKLLVRFGWRVAGVLSLLDAEHRN